MINEEIQYFNEKMNAMILRDFVDSLKIIPSYIFLQKDFGIDLKKEKEKDNVIIPTKYIGIKKIPLEDIYSEKTE